MRMLVRRKRWDKALTLYDRLEVPEELKPFVNDYRINLFEVAWLSEEQVELFKSDFKIVADYFVQMRKNREYHPSAETITHVHEVLELMTVLTDDHRFEANNHLLTQNQCNGSRVLRQNNHCIFAVGVQVPAHHEMSLYSLYYKTLTSG